MIGIKEIEQLANLAQLELTGVEKETYAGQLNDILKRITKIQQLDTRDVTPTAHVVPLQNVFREDQVGQHMDLEQALANAADAQDNFFKVPRIV